MISLLLICVSLSGQDDYPFPSLSPQGTISQVVGNTLVGIEYERPSARRRTIFGDLVPWNRVWRTGAGNCTKISFDQPVKIEGQEIAAGKYSLFSIPGPEEWVIILNADTTLYGSSFYDEQRDVARFVVIPQQTQRYYETLNIDIGLVPNNADVYISWENTQVSFRIETSTDADIEAFIRNELMSGQSQQSIQYAGAAEYRLYQGSNLLEGLTLATKAIELDESNGWARSLKIRLYERLKMYESSLAEIEQAMAQIEQASYEKEEYRANDMEELKTLQERIRKKME